MRILGIIISLLLHSRLRVISDAELCYAYSKPDSGIVIHMAMITGMNEAIEVWSADRAQPYILPLDGSEALDCADPSISNIRVA